MMALIWHVCWTAWRAEWRRVPSTGQLIRTHDQCETFLMCRRPSFSTLKYLLWKPNSRRTPSSCHVGCLINKRLKSPHRSLPNRRASHLTSSRSDVIAQVKKMPTIRPKGWTVTSCMRSIRALICFIRFSEGKVSGRGKEIMNKRGENKVTWSGLDH